jgi:hypothetical protein
VKAYNRQLRDLIVAGRAHPSFVVSKQLPLDDAPDAYERFDRREEGYSKGTWPVIQRGSYRLWDTVEHGCAAWLALGRSDPARLGVTALTTENGELGDQYVWLDHAEGVYSWPLVPPAAG